MAKKQALEKQVEQKVEASPEIPQIFKEALDATRGGMCNHVVNNPDFTGVARSVECYYNQGHNNFRILTLYIEKGKVIKMEVSDPYANFEAITKISHWQELALIHLNNKWENGKTLSK